MKDQKTPLHGLCYQATISPLTTGEEKVKIYLWQIFTKLLTRPVKMSLK